MLRKIKTYLQARREYWLRKHFTTILCTSSLPYGKRIEEADDYVQYVSSGAKPKR